MAIIMAQCILLRHKSSGPRDDGESLKSNLEQMRKKACFIKTFQSLHGQKSFYEKEVLGRHIR